jgi:alpha-N-acetylglucosamine transferase
MCPHTVCVMYVFSYYYSKLHVWNLTEYASVVYLDADLLILRCMYICVRILQLHMCPHTTIRLSL